jgi:hypothetical protein
MSNHSNPSTQSTVTKKCNTRLTALKALPSTTQIVIGGKSYTLQQAMAVYQTTLDLRTALANVRTDEKQALDESRAADQAYRAFDMGLGDWARSTYPAGSKERENLGGNRKAKAPATAEQKAEAARKAKATREARGTKGPKAKLEIKGTIPVSSAQAAPATNPTVTTVTTNGAAHS